MWVYVMKKILCRLQNETNALWRDVLRRMGKYIFLVTESKKYMKLRDVTSH